MACRVNFSRRQAVRFERGPLFPRHCFIKPNNRYTMSTTTETVEKNKYACAKDKAKEKLDDIKKSLSNKNLQEEKEKVTDKLKHITEQSLEYSAKAADFISNKAREASEKLKK